MFVFFHALFKEYLQTCHVQLNELHICFYLKNLHWYRFKIIIDQTQILLLQFD
jgi:hypothetical protein